MKKRYSQRRKPAFSERKSSFRKPLCEMLEERQLLTGSPAPEPALIGNYVFYDNDGNGIQDSGDTGVKDVLVTLHGAGADGAFGTSDDVSDTRTTTENGRYTFANLTPNEKYRLKFSNLPQDFEFTAANQGDNDSLDSDVSRSGRTKVVTLAPGEENRTLDAGIVPMKSTLGDQVFLDSNGNGRRDNDEPGVANVHVTLTGAGPDGHFGSVDDTSATKSTNAHGRYLFKHLNPGEKYKLTFSNVPDGFEFTAQDATSDGRDSDVNPATGMTRAYRLKAGQVRKNVDAGIRPVSVPDPDPTPEPARIGNRVFLDENGDGRHTEGEPGVQGVTVTLTGGGADGVIGTGGDDTTQSRLSNINGFYTFNDLNPGEEYKVTFSNLPSGLKFTTPNVGSNDRSDSDADPTTGMTHIVVLEPGEYDDSIDAGLCEQAPATSSLGGEVFNDLNGDGMQAVGEPGVPDVKVTLIGGGADGVIGTGADDTMAMMDTDGGGMYQFDDLTPGVEYKITFSELPTGFEFTTPNQGSDSFDSDADPETGMTQVVTLSPGDFNATLDAGIVPSDPVLYDVDTKACLYTEDVWFAEKPDCDETFSSENASLVLFRFDREGNSGDLGGAVELTVHIDDDEFENLDVDRVTQIDTSDLENYFLSNGGHSVRRRTFYEDDRYPIGFRVDIDGFGDGENKSSEFDSSIFALADTDETKVTITYQDSSGSTKTATICLDFTKDQEAYTPIAFDLNGNGKIDVTGDSTVKGHDFAHGATTVEFDIDADGETEHIEWLAGTGDGLLIDTTKIGPGNYIDGSALFGDEGGTYAHGYEKLALLDANGDKVISGAEAANLAVWIDDGDAKLEAGEQVSLISSLDFVISTEMSTDSHGRMTSETHFDAEAAGVVSYSLSGDDAQFFSVDSATGELTWAAGFAPATPQDANGDNVYEVTVERTGDHCDADAEHLLVDVNNGTVEKKPTSSQTAKPTGIEAQTGGQDNASLEIHEAHQSDFADSYNLYDGHGNLITTVFRSDVSETGTDSRTGLFELDWQGDDYGFDPRQIVWVSAQNFGEAESELCRAIYRNVSPIGVDLNGDGEIGVTGSSTVQGHSYAGGATVQFDIDADGSLDTIEWFAGDGDGILIDTTQLGADGEIDGSALFGDEGGKYVNGYEKLSLLDVDGDGQLSSAEASGLALWLDDGDAKLQEDELAWLDDFEIASIRVEMELDAEGRMRSTAQRNDGSTVLTEDVWFARV